MRLALADLFFSWPPHGGANVDLYNIAEALQDAGHEVSLFFASRPDSAERGSVARDALPFPAIPLDFSPRNFNRRAMPARFRQAIDSWKPTAVLLGAGFFLKPYLIEALERYPLIARYYAYELECPRDFRLFKNGAACPHNYFQTPRLCRRCTLEALRHEIKSGRFAPWTEEYLKARAFMPGYYHRLIGALRTCRALIVYNRIMKQNLEGIHDHVYVVPGGVNVNEFDPAPPPEKKTGAVKTIVMTGRTEDPLKGLHTLRDAGDRLAQKRSDFIILATHTDASLNTPHFNAIGWRGHDALVHLYREADICVVPSVWQEPFGMVAVEAMAAARPLCAARAGGLQDIVAEGETGLLFDPGDSAALAAQLELLLDDAPRRKRLGAAARRRAEDLYDWKRIVAKHYLPLLERLVP